MLHFVDTTIAQEQSLSVKFGNMCWRFNLILLRKYKYLGEDDISWHKCCEN